MGASGTLRLVRITNTAGLAWMAAEATDLNFSLEFGPLALAVTNGRLVLNQAPVGQTPIDWTDSVVVGELPIDFGEDLNGSKTLLVSGSASIDLVGLLTVSGTFELTQFNVTGAAALAMFGDGSDRVRVAAGRYRRWCGRLVRCRALGRCSSWGSRTPPGWRGWQRRRPIWSSRLAFGPLKLSVSPRGLLVLNQAPVGQTPINWTGGLGELGGITLMAVTSSLGLWRFKSRGSRRRSMLPGC